MEEEKVRSMVMGVSEKFNLERAVCNHGFFMMAPNKWIPSKKTLVRPVTLVLHNNHSLLTTLSITQPSNKHYILITISPPLSPQHRHSIQCQVARMLRISEEDEMMVEEFHKVHPSAKKSGFGRIFRSPTLFEDIVKSLLLCYCGWGRSLEMAEALCTLQYKLYGKKKKRKRKKKIVISARKDHFPCPKDIVACLDDKTLNKYCNLGFRASIILELARDVESGTLNLDDLATSHHKLLWSRLIKIKGFGSFTVANIMMCLGFYHHIPIDTETIKHLQQVHGKTELNSKSSKRETESIVAQIYDKYAPFQCLAYWMEHICYYEKYLGKLSELPTSKYCNVTSTNFQVHSSGNEDREEREKERVM